MSREIYHIGHEAGSVSSTAGWTTTAGRFDPDYSRCAINAATGSSATINLASVVGESSADGYWLHLLVKRTTYNYFGTMIGYSGAYPSFKVDDNAGIFVYPFHSSTGAATATVTAMQVTPLSSYDIHVYTNGGNAVLDFYLNGTLVGTVITTVGGTSNSGLDRLTFTGTSNAAFFSEIIVANFDTRGMRAHTLVPSAAGTYSEGTGSYTDVDEITPDGSGVVFGATGQRFTCLTPGVSTPRKVVGLSVNAYASTGAATKIQSLIRVGGTDYLGGEITRSPVLTAGRDIQLVNPATSLPWAVADLAAIQFGVETVAV